MSKRKRKKHQRLSLKERLAILRAKLLRKGKVTPKEYKQLRGLALKQQRQSLKLKQKDFEVDIYRIIHLKKGGRRKIQINAEDFVSGKDYEIYIRHKPTRQKRLLSIGKLHDLPITSKQMEIFGTQLAGRTFDPTLKYPKRRKGRWIPVDRITRRIEREMRQLGKEFETEVRAQIIPMKRYFHSQWKIYADNPIKGNTLVKVVFVHAAVRFVYPSQDWIGKQSIYFEFPNYVMIKNLHKLVPQIEEQLNFDLEKWHPNADMVSLVEVNGFIPSLKQRVGEY